VFAVHKLGDAEAHDGMVIHQQDSLPAILRLILFQLSRDHYLVCRLVSRSASGPRVRARAIPGGKVTTARPDPNFRTAI